MSLPERIPARTEVPTEDGLFTVEENTYHRDRGSLSCSGAKLLLPPSCPAKFRQRMDNPPPPKPHFDFGSIVHTLTLGAGSDYVVLEPAVHGLKKDGTVADSPTATTAWKAADAEARALGKIPIHVLDDNTVLFDSRVIVEYLDNVAPNNKLMPGQNRERTEVKRWEALADGVCDAAALVFLEKKRPGAQQSGEWMARQEDKIIRSLEFMSGELADNTWCMGTHFSLADVAVGCALGYLAFRFPDIDWQEKHPNLARLYEKLMRRRAFLDTVPQI